MSNDKMIKQHYPEAGCETAELSASTDAVYTKKRVVPIAPVLLCVVVFIAMDGPGMIDGMFNLNVLRIGRELPAFSTSWAPVVLCSLLYAWFVRFKSVTVPVSRSFLLFISFLFIFIVIETAVSIMGTRIPDYTYIMGIFWVGFLFMALVGLTDIVGARSLLTIVPAVGAFITILLLIAWHSTYPAHSLVDYLFSFSGRRLQVDWKYTNRFSYFAAICAVTALYRVVRSRTDLSGMFFYISLYFVNILGILVNKSKGGWVVLLAGTAVILFGRLTEWSFRYALYTGMLLAVMIMAQILYNPLPKLNDILSLGRGGISYQEEVVRRDAARERNKFHIDSFTSVGSRFAFARTWWNGVVMDRPIIGVGVSGLDKYRIQLSSRTVGMHGTPFILTLAYGVPGALFLLFSFFMVVRWKQPGRITPYGATLLAMTTASIMITGHIPLWVSLSALLIYRSGEIWQDAGEPSSEQERRNPGDGRSRHISMEELHA